MTRVSRRLTAASASAAALALAVASSAAAAPVDLDSEDTSVVVGNTVWCMYDNPFSIDEATLYVEPPVDVVDCYSETTEEANGDAFDGAWEIWVYDEAEDTGAFYGDVDGPFVVDKTTADNGDVVVQGPVEQLEGLDVSVQHRYYAEGDLVRVLVTLTNTTDADVTRWIGTDSNLGSDGDETIHADTTDDGVVTEADLWAVHSDGGQYDPIITTVVGGPEGDGRDIFEIGDGYVYTEDGVTIAAGETVHLAFFMALTGYDYELEGDFDAAVAAAIEGVGEFGEFDGRLIAGLPEGAVVLNFGVVPGAVVEPPVEEPPVEEPPVVAPPATPVVAEPSFTG